MLFSNAHSITINPNCKVHLLAYDSFDINDYEGQLLPSELKRLSEISNPVKKQEYVASRLLKSKIYPGQEIRYNEVGAPYLSEDLVDNFISLSHTIGIVGFAEANYKVGLDLEPIRNLAKKIHKRFINEHEKSLLDIEDDLQMTMAWSAKESLYKLANRKEIIFTKELLIQEIISENHWLCSVKTDKGFREIPMHFYHSGNNVLSINDSF